MIEIDGGQHSGSGTIVRQSVFYAALTSQGVHITRARERRLKPGLQPQHVKVVEAIAGLVGGRTEGVTKGSQELTFRPGRPNPNPRYLFDIGSAGSTTMLALALLPVLAFRSQPATVELRGGVFQDFAPSVFHLQHVVLPLLARMGLRGTIEMRRPGYVPVGGGILDVAVEPLDGTLAPLVLDQAGPVERVWGVALASHLAERDVAGRIARSATEVLAGAGCRADIETRDDETALQAGAVFALFADLATGSRLGADQAGAPRRPSEAIGKHTARQLLEDVGSGAAIDRFAADQVIAFAAMADGESRFRIPGPNDHIQSNAWLAHRFLGAEVEVSEGVMVVKGVGFRRG